MRPSYSHRIQCTAILCSIVLCFLNTTNCLAQNADCDQTLTTEIDTVAKETIIRSQKNIIITEDGGKTGFALYFLLVDSTFMATIKTVGGSACVNEGDLVRFVFADSSSVEIQNMAKYNCQATSLLYFNTHYNNLDLLEILAQKRLTKLTVWTKQKSVARNVSEEAASKIHDHLACLKSSLGHSTFLKLLNGNSSKIHTAVEKQPEFDGGESAMLNFLLKNMRYPAAARRLGVQGTVYVGFLVDKNGLLSEVKTIIGVHPTLDAEAERVIKLMPPWLPARQDGMPVTAQFVLPIKFKLG